MSGTLPLTQYLQQLYVVLCRVHFSLASHQLPMASLVSKFLRHHYPGLSLRAPLFYSWPVGIRFDLQNDSPNIDDEYFREVEHRAVRLFETTFLPTDSILVVYQESHFKRTRIRSGNFLRRQTPLSKTDIHFQKIPNPYPGTHMLGKWTRMHFSSLCATIPYTHIFAAIGHQDFPARSPRLHGELYFLNQRTGLILYMYDDRGLDILGPAPADLRHLYETYNHWILEYDQERIDTTFAR